MILTQARFAMQRRLVVAVFVGAVAAGDGYVATAQQRNNREVLSRESLESSEKLLPTLRGKPGLHQPLLNILTQLAAGYGDFAELDKALAYAKEALDVARQMASPYHEAVVGVTLGNIYRLRLEIPDARRSIEGARQRLETLRDSEPRASQHLGNAYNNLGLIDADLGRYEAAAKRFEEAAAIHQSSPRVPGSDRDLQYKQLEGNSRSNLANCLMELGRAKEALRQQQRAVALANDTGDRIAQASARDFLGMLHIRAGDRLEAIAQFEQAIAQFEQAIALARELQHQGVEAGALQGLATAQARLGRAAAAEEAYRRTIEIRDALGQRGQAQWFGSRVELARLLDTQGRTAEAASLFEEAVGVFRERLTSHVAFLSETEQVAFRNSLASVVDEYFSFSVRHAARDPQAIGRMMDVLLWEKGFVVSEATRLRAVSDADGARELSEQLVGARRAASSAARTEDTTAGRAAQEKVLDIERRLAAVISAHRGEPVNTTWRDVQRALQPRQAAVEIASYASRNVSGTLVRRVVALILRADSRPPALVDLGTRDAVQRALDDYVRLTCGSPDAGAGQLATKVLWTPLRDAIGPADHITIAAEEALHTINWNILPLDAKRRVIDAYDVRVVSSTRDLLRVSRTPRPGRAVLVADPSFGTGRGAASPATAAPAARGLGGLATQQVGLCRSQTCPAKWGRLEGTAKEIRLIEPILARAGWQIERQLGDAASEERIKQTSRPALLHVATHGCFSAQSNQVIRDPMLRSYLALAGVNERTEDLGRDDGALTAYEAAGLDLQGTELVVLSACDTGLGETSKGEGVFGLRRAFQLAGAKAVLMTLWQVPDDETAELMKRFYTLWTSGHDKRAALRRAQREYRDALRTQGKDNPFYWGAFVLVE